MDCPNCGQPIPADAPARLCAACLVDLCLVESEEEPAPAGSEGRMFGDYELIRQIGRGAMGLVYLARQGRIGRVLALKMLNPVQLVSSEHLARFRAEVQTVAALEHPNILPVYDFGEVGGQPYFTSRYMANGSLADSIERGDFREPRKGERRAAELMRQVALAVHHAHQRGILHRDLKPANVLLDEDGRPFVGDFGLAKNLETPADLTCSDAIFGTPAYMAPELAEGGARHATVAADLFSLGAILYHMICGQPPFEARTALEALRLAREGRTPSPSSRRPGLSRDLETVCLKCLEARPEDRYASAAELADDLGRFLDGSPVHARPLPFRVQVARWCRRHPGVVALSVLLLVSMVLGTALSLGQARKANRLAAAERQALRLVQSSAEQMKRQVLALNLQQVASESGGVPQALARLAAILRAHPDNRIVAGWVRELLRDSFILPVCDETRLGTESAVPFLSPDGRHLVLATTEGALSCWHVAGPARRVWQLDSGYADARVALSLDSNWAAVCGDRGSVLIDVASGAVSPLDTAGLGVPSRAAFSPDSSQVAVGFSSGAVGLWRVADRQRHWSVNVQTSAVSSVQWNPSGTWIFTVGPEVAPCVLTAEDGRLLRRAKRPAGPAGTLAVLRDGERFAYDGADGRVLVCDAETGVVAIAHDRDHGAVTEIHSSERFNRILVLRDGRSPQVLDADRPTRNLYALQASPGMDARFVSEGHALVGVSLDGSARLLDAARGVVLASAMDQRSRIVRLSVSQIGRKVATVSEDGAFRVWEWPPPIGLDPILETPRQFLRAVLCGNTPAIATLDQQGALMLWRIPEVQDPWNAYLQPEVLNASASELAACPSGRWLFSWEGSMGQVWDVARGTSVANLRGSVPIRRVAFDPTGSVFAMDAAEGVVAIRETAAWDRTVELEVPGVLQVALSSSAHHLLTGGSDGRVRLWLWRERRVVAEERLDDAPIVAVGFSPDGSRAFAATQTGQARVWDVTPWRPATPVLENGLRVFSGALEGSTGEQLLLARNDGTVVLHDWRHGAAPELFFHAGLGQSRATVRLGWLDSRGDWVASYGSDGRLTFRDRESKLPLLPDLRHGTRQFPPLFSPDRRRLLVAVSTRRLRVAKVEPRVHVAPTWLPDFLEDLSGLKLLPDGALAWSPPASIDSLRQKYPLSDLQDRAWLPFNLR